MSDFNRALEIAQIVAKSCSKRWHIDYDCCLSDAFLAITKAFPRFDPSMAKLETYLTKCIKRQIFDTQRSEGRRRAKGDVHAWVDVGCEAPANSQSDDLIVRALEKVAQGKRTDTVRRELRKELAAEGWKKEQISEAFSEVQETLGRKVHIVFEG